MYRGRELASRRSSGAVQLEKEPRLNHAVYEPSPQEPEAAGIVEASSVHGGDVWRETECEWTGIR